MKKLFTILLGLVLSIGIYAQQVDRDMVVIEGATGFW